MIGPEVGSREKLVLIMRYLRVRQTILAFWVLYTI
jgi:hypothetical protein